MAEHAEKKPEGGGEAEAKPAKKKPPMVPIAVVAAVMAVEGALVFVVAGMTKGGQTASASELHEGGHGTEGEEMAEVPVFQGKFQNQTSGKVWIWETEIVLEVRQKHAEHITHELERRQAAVRDAISRIYRRAQLAQLREPGSETITRQLTTMLDEFFGPDAEGHSMVERVLVPVCDGYSADF